MAVIAGVYLGLALAARESGALLVELGISCLFAAAALPGLLLHPVVIPLAIMAHGVWDFVHYVTGPSSYVPRWYPSFCLIVDMVLGSALAVVYIGYG